MTNEENLEHEGVEVEDSGILKELDRKAEEEALEMKANAYKKIKIKKIRIIPQKEEEIEYSVEDIENKIVEIEREIADYKNRIIEQEENLIYMNNLLLEVEKEAKKII